jgi:hypothetical protein
LGGTSVVEMTVTVFRYVIRAYPTIARRVLEPTLDIFCSVITFGESSAEEGDQSAGAERSKRAMSIDEALRKAERRSPSLRSTPRLTPTRGAIAKAGNEVPSAPFQLFGRRLQLLKASPLGEGDHLMVLLLGAIDSTMKSEVTTAGGGSGDDEMSAGGFLNTDRICEIALAGVQATALSCRLLSSRSDDCPVGRDSTEDMVQISTGSLDPSLWSFATDCVKMLSMASRHSVHSKTLADSIVSTVSAGLRNESEFCR